MGWITSRLVGQGVNRNSIVTITEAEWDAQEEHKDLEAKKEIFSAMKEKSTTFNPQGNPKDIYESDDDDGPAQVPRPRLPPSNSKNNMRS